MILTAVGIFFNIDRKFQTAVLEAFPQYGAGLTKIEDNTLVEDTLNSISGQQGRFKGQPKNGNALPEYAAAPELVEGGKWFNSSY